MNLLGTTNLVRTGSKMRRRQEFLYSPTATRCWANSFPLYTWLSYNNWPPNLEDLVEKKMLEVFNRYRSFEKQKISFIKQRRQKASTWRYLIFHDGTRISRSELYTPREILTINDELDSLRLRDEIFFFIRSIK